MKSVQFNISLKIVLFGLLLLLLGYLFPFLEILDMDYIKRFVGTSGGDTILKPLERSALFAIFTSIITVTLALGISLALKRVSLGSTKAIFLNVLLLPVVLGNLSTAFLFKLIFFKYSIVPESSLSIFILSGLIYFWQYGTLFIYVFWLNQQMVSKQGLQFGKAVKLTPFESSRDLVLPRQYSLYILLSVVCYLLSFYEDIKFAFIFKSSRGNDTELISQWLNRSFHSASTVNPDFGFKYIAGAAVIVILVALGILLLLVGFELYVYSKILRTKRSVSFLKSIERSSSFLVYFLVFFIVTPLAIVLSNYTSIVNFNSSTLSTPFSLTVLASLAATVVAVLFSIVSRVVWKKTLSNLNKKSILFLGVILMLLLVPPLVILISGFKWMRTLAYDSGSLIHIIWIAGHIILSFPLLASFSVAAHFKVQKNSIDFATAHSIGYLEQFRDLFWGPMRLDYFFLFILSFSTIWNEATINRILSDVIPSFAVELNKSITGQGTDYGIAMQFLYISVFLSILSIGIWSGVISKIQKQRESA